MRRTFRFSSLREVGLAALLSVVAALVIFGILVAGDDEPDEPSSSAGTPELRARAVEYQRRTIYESPQDPGFTEFTGAWIGPDETLMTAFVQATGPVDPVLRASAPASVRGAFAGESAFDDPQRDFWGLDQEVKYLRSADGGDSFEEFRSDPFQAPGPYAYTPQATIALEDGTLLRRVNGYDIRYDESVPHTAYFQRLAPGSDTWSEPQVLLDPERFTYQISRIRRLSDGRLIALGQVWDVPAGSPQSMLNDETGRLLLMVSADEGDNWEEAMTIPPESQVAPNEWDAAELENGDLLAVIRTRDDDDPTEQVRKQGLLRKDADGWELTNVRDAPFPHSGHPELLATEEGPVLHIATTGIQYTTDEGATWRPLRFPAAMEYASAYYPRSVQLADGTICVVGHRGADDPYGEVDQAIVMDRFRLETSERR